MINNRNKMIVLLVSLLLVVGSVVLILNKDEKIRKVESDSKKYLISINDSTSNNDCDMYFKDIENRFYNYNEVEEGYPLYIYNHCAWKVDALIKNSNVDDVLKENACKVYKTYVNDKLLSKNDDVWSYNNTCGSLSGTLDVQYDGKNCSQLKEQIEKDYVSNTSEYNVFKNDMKCVNSVGDIDKTKLKPYYTNEENCETLKLVDRNGNLYNGVLKSGEIVYETGKNQCSYPLYFLNGYATSIDDFMNKTNDSNKKNACNVLREYAQAGGKSDINNYNKYCKNISGYQEIEGSDFTDNINQIHKTCDDAGDSQSTLTSKIDTTFQYTSDGNTNKEQLIAVNDGYKNAVTSSGKSYTLNKYTTLTCSESFQYTYPSIFETVKSGTYFELIYNPQIHSTYTCQQTFDYASWENDYKEAIREELLVQLDKSNYNSKDNINEVKVGTCGDENSYELREATINYYNSYSFDEKNKNIINLIPSKGKYTLQYCSNKQVNVQDLYLNYVKSLVDNSKTLSEIFNDTNGIDDYVNKHVGNREILKTINDNYKNILSKSSISSDNYYKLSPTIKFEYENNNKVTKKIDLVFKNNDQYEKDNFKYANVDYDNVSNMSFNNVTYSWNIDGMNYDGSSVINKYDYPITRTKEIRLTYEQEQNNDNYFYADYQTGKITSKKDTKSTKNKIDLGYVYPVDLNSSGQRNISFKLNTNSGISTPVKQILEKNNNNTYKCNFKITNDAVIKNNDTSSKLDGEKYKVKFYVRPIATNDIDPNNRLDSGLLGANWASRKGQLLMRIIEKKSKGNNTYNPDNLEYSFTLSAQNIDKIREYNELNKYDDFRLECNNMGGECNSDFLDNFEKGYYGSVVNTVNKDGRNRRKYYINGKWYRTDSLLPKNDFTEVYSGTKYRKESVYGVCDSSCKEDVNKCYECLYRKVNKGVLP